MPYQPLGLLSASLSAADVHAIVLGDRFAGIVHPCKIYNVLRVGLPFIAVGPRAEPLADLASDSEIADMGISVRHGEVDAIEEFLQEAAAASEWRSLNRDLAAASRFAKAALLPLMLAKMEVSDERSEVRGRKSEVGSQRSEFRSQRPEVGGPRSEVGGQKSEAEGRRYQ